MELKRFFRLRGRALKAATEAAADPEAPSFGDLDTFKTARYILYAGLPAEIFGAIRNTHRARTDITDIFKAVAALRNAARDIAPHRPTNVETALHTRIIRGPGGRVQQRPRGSSLPIRGRQIPGASLMMTRRPLQQNGPQAHFKHRLPPQQRPQGNQSTTNRDNGHQNINNQHQQGQKPNDPNDQDTRCFRCGNSGHFARECHLPPNQELVHLTTENPGMSQEDYFMEDTMVDEDGYCYDEEYGGNNTVATDF
ncbi:hypothetical protein HDU67_008222 [Dinochytrium kinnereticum]|nr:hypothetical protein HDU67_008222 [Dinochytrium kinnereticum]